MLTARIVRIGNSRGIRIPKLLLERIGLDGEVELQVHDHELVVRPLNAPRRSWEQAFRSMSQHGDDRLLDEPEAVLSQWDADEWQW